LGENINFSEGNNFLHKYLNNVNRKSNGTNVNDEEIRQTLYDDTLDAIRRDFRGIDDDGNRIKSNDKRLQNLLPIVGQDIAQSIIYEQHDTRRNGTFHNLN
jgi:hypothetical protein